MPDPLVTEKSNASSVPIAPQIQRLCPECEDELLQAKEIPGQTGKINSNIEANINAIRSGGQSLPNPVRAYFEPRFRYDFREVRIHTGAKATENSRALNAHAFAIGNDIVFGAGQYAPDTLSGRRILAHELEHVVQQNNSGIQKIQLMCADHPDESYYRNNARFCQDTESTGAMHPGHRCYREVPAGSGCPSGEHVCFRRDTSECDSNESHIDTVAPSISRNTDGTCDLSGFGGCSILHGIVDVVAPQLGPPSTDPNSLEYRMWLRYHRLL